MLHILKLLINSPVLLDLRGSSWMPFNDVHSLKCAELAFVCKIVICLEQQVR